MDCMLVVLAAGRGARFLGQAEHLGHKLDQPFGRSTVLGSTLAHAAESGLPLVVVTTAARLEPLRGWVAAEDVVVLPEVGSAEAVEPLGMGYSIAAGVSARPNAAAWLVLPGDMPLVRPESIRAVADAMAHHPVAYAQHQGRRGHPVGFAAELYSELARLSGDEGARRLIGRYPSHGVELPDPGVLQDLDTVDDLRAMRAAQAVATDTEPLTE